MPIQGGCDGGNIHVEYNGEKKVFDLHQEPREGFSTAVIFNCCNHWMEPITRGSKLFFVYNLILTEEIPFHQDFPSFLTALKEVQESMESWKTVSRIIQKQEDVKVLYFTLEEQYESSLSFKHLQGGDKKMAYIFQNIAFLEVALAQVSHQVAINEEAGKQREILRWVDSSDSPIDLTLELDRQKHYSGYGRMFTSGSLAVEETDFSDTILVVWPKHQSFQLFCRYGHRSLLDEIEKSYQVANHAFKGKEEPIRWKVIQNLQKIIAAHKDPILQLKNEANYFGRLTEVLQFCTRLQALQGGLSLLEMLQQATGIIK